MDTHETRAKSTFLFSSAVARRSIIDDEETDPDDAKDIVKFLTHPHLSRPALMPRRGWTSLRHTEAPAGHTSHGECGLERGIDGHPVPRRCSWQLLPPGGGEQLMAAPLLTTTTLLPGSSGLSSASRSQVNAILTSVCQLTENVSHVWYWSGRITGLAPATRMRTSGSYWSSRLHATVASAASATSVRMFALVVASSASAGPVPATATTGAPASANARAIPRPRPRLAPTTTVVLPDKSLIIVPFLCMSLLSLVVVLVVAAGTEARLRG